MSSFFSKMRDGLLKTATSISRSVSSIFTGKKAWSQEDFALLERTLIEADFGVRAARAVTDEIKRRYQIGEIKTDEDIRRISAETIRAMLEPGCRPLRTNPDGLTVILFTGVNGSGKTTSIGKLATRWTREGKRVMLAACDTFRAAAAQQLQLWAERSDSDIVSSRQGADPASVAFDAVKAALARKMDILLIDTAGRQQNRKHLMDELSKMRRTIEKVLPGAPHETILTLDASLGTNAFSQAREFAAASGAGALILTKLDGTGKGGAACSVQQDFNMPILFVGLGESPEDLRPFSPAEYADSLFAGDPVTP